MNKFIYLLSVVGLMAACTGKNTTTINGTVKNSNQEKVFLEKIKGDGLEILDSTILNEEGKFEFSFQWNEPGIYRLNFEEKAKIDLCIMQPESITIEADEQKNEEDYLVNGSPASTTIHQMNSIMFQAFRSLNELKLIYQEKITDKNEDSLSKALDNQYASIVSSATGNIKAIIDTLTNDFLKVYAVNYLDPDMDQPTINKVYNEVKESNYAYILNFIQKIDALKNTAIGGIAPEIKLNDPLGNEKKLSDFKGKFVLIDFWASWCAPCRAENPNLVKVFNQFKNRNFTILSVSLDKEKEAWLKAIKDDNLTWTHVSDLMYWNSKAANDYRIQAIPSSFLIDPTGKIIAKNLLSDELAKVLEEYLPRN